jgi:hypothetical protein
MFNNINNIFYDNKGYFKNIIKLVNVMKFQNLSIKKEIKNVITECIRN